MWHNQREKWFGIVYEAMQKLLRKFCKKCFLKKVKKCYKWFFKVGKQLRKKIL